MKNPIPLVTNPARPNPQRLAHFAQLALLAAAMAASQSPAYGQENLGEIEEITVVGERRAQDRITLSDSGIGIYGHVQGSYTYNLADPGRRKSANRYRLSDTDHNSFGVPMAKVGLRRRLSGLNEFDAGFRLELAAGRMVEEVYADSLSGGSDLAISQGYVDLQIPTPLSALRLRAGRMHAWFGTESLDVYKNPNFSLSPLTLATPNTVTGMSLGMDLGAGFTYTQYLAQGWDVVEDNNDSKTFGGQLSWRGDELAVALNWVVGAERANSSSYSDEEDDLRWAMELSARWAPAFGTELRASLLYGQERFPDDVAKFGGLSVGFSQGLFEVESEGYHRLTAALRASYLRDQGGARTGLDQALGEVTATLGVNFTASASLRAEYRRDFSSKDDAFLGSRGRSSRSGQDTFSLALHYAF